ncbi:MAG TPA: hypothetical protein VGP72_02005 [Planctomycetota bacterium]|jgi:hypothetical protein
MTFSSPTAEYRRMIRWGALMIAVSCGAGARSEEPNSTPTAQTDNNGGVPAEVERAMRLPVGAERTKALQSAAQGWAQNHPAAVLSWLHQLPRNQQGIGLNVVGVCARTNGKVSADWSINKGANAWLHQLLVGWAVADPRAAEAWCVQTAIPKEVRFLAFASVGDGACRKDPPLAAAWAAKLEANEDRLAAISGVALLWGRANMAAATVWVKQLQPLEAQIAARTVVADWKANKFHTQEGAKDTVAIRAFLEQLALSGKEKNQVLNSPQINWYIPNPLEK